MGAGTPSKRSRVFLVDDQTIIRKALCLLLNGEPDLTVCAEAGDVSSALKGIQDTRPDLVLLSLYVGEETGLEIARIVRDRRPKLPVLVLSAHDEAFFAERALRAGASGYLMKREQPEVLLEAIRLVLSGAIYLSPGVSGKLLREITGRPAGTTSPLGRLTDRELEIFRLMGRGYPPREIAAKLHVSVKTVEAHRAHMMEKLQLGSASELLRKAIAWTKAEGL